MTPEGGICGCLTQIENSQRRAVKHRGPELRRFNRFVKGFKQKSEMTRLVF